MSILSGWKITVLALLSGIALGWYVQGLRWDADVAERGKKASEDISTGQQAIIAGQALQFQRFNEIAKQANQYAINIKGQSDEKQIIYRTIIKRDPASGKCVPDDVADRLLDYTYRLRASAMHTVTERTDTARTGAAATGCRLTYAQAVYWIDPLLTAIDEANSQLAGIREAESNWASQ
ncbi:hypothetical protein GMW39_10530 [Pectobacterium parmentieri]|uniref:Uncharacterized protein n=1 Tax=Pectobacterium quasiaquaticum TaxID=2774015 RepID=A0A9Q2I7V6_9GAMM|nr:MULTISPECIES: hypothetical protein [Pectobacterium]MBE5213261.1 hypothetical protein [Pectobacterium quasiaquaticum]MBE5221618.1 hypothetical protein [Pectobacterium quasiaquaticum]MBE5224089.1 hypothetical protein [Pectobacterium quasiaquaticum]QHQ16263.1 hypothetical protein GMW39_10530 [Pectobacterium parmentieri]URG50609.1 hypothetical protein IG609_008975 [Pectobacterium quasiaquaticum]